MKPHQPPLRGESAPAPLLVSLYVMRHFETPENKLGIIQGQSIDNGLTSLGRRGAVAAGRSWLHSHLPPCSPSSSSSSSQPAPSSAASSRLGLETTGWDEVISSPMRRTRETIEAMIAGTGYETLGCRCKRCRLAAASSSSSSSCSRQGDDDDDDDDGGGAGEAMAPPPHPQAAAAAAASSSSSSSSECLVKALRECVVYDSRLLERAHGVREGLRNDVSYTEALALREAALARDAPEEDRRPTPTAETLQQLERRAGELVDDIVGRARNDRRRVAAAEAASASCRTDDDDDDVVVVASSAKPPWKVLLLTHGGVIRSLLLGVCKVTSCQVKALNGSVTRVDIREGGQEGDDNGGKNAVTFELVGTIGDVAHLPKELVTTRTEW